MVSEETRDKLSKAMRGQRNAAGKHKMSESGSAAISAAQKDRWRRWREEKQRKEEKS